MGFVHTTHPQYTTNIAQHIIHNAKISEEAEERPGRVYILHVLFCVNIFNANYSNSLRKKNKLFFFL